MRQDFRWLGFGFSALAHAGLVFGLNLPVTSGEPAAGATAPPLVLELAMFAPEPQAMVAIDSPVAADAPAETGSEPAAAAADEVQPQAEAAPLPESGRPPPADSRPEPDRPVQPKSTPKEPARRPAVASHRSPASAVERKTAARPVTPVSDPDTASTGEPSPVPTAVPSQPATAGPAPAASHSDRLALIERDYLARLSALIQRQRFYPRTSRRLREEGTVVVRLVLAPDGAFSELAVADSSGVERLDRAALETLNKVTRFDPVPASLGRERWQIAVPIVYRLH